MFKFLFLLFFSFYCYSYTFVIKNGIKHNKNIKKVVIIDTGVDKYIYKNVNKYRLCEKDHFSYNQTLIEKVFHGSLLVKEFHKTTKKQNYCLVIVKIDNMDMKTIEKGLLHVNSLTHVSSINYSMVDYTYYEPEHRLFSKLLDKGIKIYISSGNNGVNLDKVKVYPVVLDRRFIISSFLVNNKKDPLTNFGSYVDRYINVDMRFKGSSVASVISMAQDLNK